MQYTIACKTSVGEHLILFLTTTKPLIEPDGVGYFDSAHGTVSELRCTLVTHSVTTHERDILGVFQADPTICILPSGGV